MKPKRDKKNWRDVTRRIQKTTLRATNEFQGIVKQQSKGIAIQQLRQGVTQQRKSRGSPQGQAQQKMLRGKAVRMLCTRGGGEAEAGLEESHEVRRVKRVADWVNRF